MSMPTSVAPRHLMTISTQIRQEFSKPYRGSSLRFISPVMHSEQKNHSEHKLCYKLSLSGKGDQCPYSPFQQLFLVSE